MTAAAVAMFATGAQAGESSLKDSSDGKQQQNWAGPYVGVHVGYGRGDNDWGNWYDPNYVHIPGNSYPGPDASYDVGGGLAGGQIGYNWQRGRLVFGVEADVNWANIDGAGASIAPPPFDYAPSCLQQTYCKTSIEAFGTFTGRLGFTIDNALFFAKGGAAWAHVTQETGFEGYPDFPGLDYWADPSETRWGWTIGAGAELAFAGNWSLRAEYNYIDLGSDRVQFTYSPAQDFGANAESELQLHTFNVGLNYHFGN
jgi:outer membrane immunogenic protein